MQPCRTAQLAESGTLDRIATVDEVARVIELFAGPMSAFVSGQVLRVDGGGSSGRDRYHFEFDSTARGLNNIWQITWPAPPEVNARLPVVRTGIYRTAMNPANTCATVVPIAVVDRCRDPETGNARLRSQGGSHGASATLQTDSSVGTDGENRHHHSWPERTHHQLQHRRLFGRRRMYRGLRPSRFARPLRVAVRFDPEEVPRGLDQGDTVRRDVLRFCNGDPEFHGNTSDAREKFRANLRNL
jgi:hypothetical protein